MTNELTQGIYREWLASQIEPVPDKGYTNLHHILFITPFTWMVPNDDNRLSDGLDLRREFLEKVPAKPEELEDLPGSVLEVIVALSRHMAFLTDFSQEYWAKKMLDNLGLLVGSDPLSDHEVVHVEDILERMMWRTYEADGTGGLFPLAFPPSDQREVELWYQMNAYIEENEAP